LADVDIDALGSTVGNLAVEANRSRFITLHVSLLAGATAISRLAVRSAWFEGFVTVCGRLLGLGAGHGKKLPWRIDRL
jgi:hypothetical protein